MTIIWTDFAIKNLKSIFDYYAKNANRNVAHSIRKQLLKSTRQLRIGFESGQIEPNLENFDKQFRYIVSGNYKVIYRVFEDQIIITDVFDTRQNPIKMNDETREIE